MADKIFTAEMLEKFGGKMKAPPADMEKVPKVKPEPKKPPSIPKGVKIGPEPLNFPLEPDQSADKPATPVKKAGGGSASSRADGCCERGKTRGKMVTMG
jgi:hypothetical protein